MDAAILTSLQQTQPRESTIVMGVWLTGFILFVIATIATGFIAKRIENIHNPTYLKAFLAQFLISFASLAGLALFGLYFQAPPLVALAIAYSVIPIIVYKVVFAATVGEAAIIWIVVLLVQGVTGLVLNLVGVVQLGQLLA